MKMGTKYRDREEPKGMPPYGERRGMDTAVLTYIKALHDQFVEAHAHVHDTFVESHTREHELQDETTQRALVVAGERLQAELEHIAKIMDERQQLYTQRFEADERAVVVALEAVTREFHEHLSQYRQETRLAMDAAEKAINKESQFTTAQLTSLSEKVTSGEQRTASSLADIVSRLDRGLGETTGVDKKAETNRSNIGVIVGVLGALFGLMSIIGTIIFVVIALSSQTP